MKATIVLHSKVRQRVNNEISMEWHAITATGRPGEATLTIVCLDRDSALQIIDSRNLVPIHTTDDGTVYDSARGRFKHMFPKGLSTKQKRQLHNYGL